MTYYKTPLWVCEVYSCTNKHWNKRTYADFINWKEYVEIQSMKWFKKIWVIKYLYYLLLSKI